MNCNISEKYKKKNPSRETDLRQRTHIQRILYFYYRFSEFYLQITRILRSGT